MSEGRVTVHLDVSEKPELADWGNRAKELIERWYQLGYLMS